MSCKIILSVVLVLSCLANICYGQAYAVLLRFPPGSGANGMGSAYTAVANDFSALYYNPAGISRLERGSAGFYRHKWLDTFPITFIGGTHTTRFGSIGFAFDHFDLGFQPSFGPEELNSYERAFQFTYANQINDHLAFGGTLKLIQIKFDQGPDFPDLTANAWGFDIGILVQNVFPSWTYSRTSPGFPERLRRFDRPNGFQGLAFGLALLNAGPERLSVLDTSPGEPLPQILRLGVAFNAVNTDEIGVLLALDLDNLLVEREASGQQNGFLKSWFTAWDDGFDNFRFGAEIEIYHIFAVRFGRDEFLNSSPNTTASEWTFGFGLGPEWARLNLVRRGFPISARNKKWVVDFAIAY